jgi:hypothetical protein
LRVIRERGHVYKLVDGDHVTARAPSVQRPPGPAAGRCAVAVQNGKATRKGQARSFIGQIYSCTLRPHTDGTPAPRHSGAARRDVTLYLRMITALYQSGPARGRRQATRCHEGRESQRPLWSTRTPRPRTHLISRSSLVVTRGHSASSARREATAKSRQHMRRYGELGGGRRGGGCIWCRPQQPPRSALLPLAKASAQHESLATSLCVPAI